MLLHRLIFLDVVVFYDLDIHSVDLHCILETCNYCLWPTMSSISNMLTHETTTRQC